ncbi:MAG: ROK family protein [Spirochaetales bacterium]
MQFIGVDLGGTRMRAALVDLQGQVSGFQDQPTDATRTPAELVRALARLVEAVEASCGRRGLPVGVGVPTTVRADGTLAACPNLPTLPDGYDLARLLEGELSRPVRLDNDARCFTLGELFWGQGRGLHTFAGVTLGTSIGLGLVVGGAAHRGFRGEAGEIWRSPVGLEALAPTLHDQLSGAAIALAAGTVDGAEAARKARQGDTRAQAAWQAYGQGLGLALSWVCDVVDPERVVLGGSVAASFDLFGDRLRAVLGGRKTELVVSKLGDHAALLGAASLVMENEGGPR